MNGQRHHGDLRPFLFDQPGHFDAGHIGQANIHQDEIGLQLLHLIERLVPAACFAHDLHVGFVAEQHPQTGAHHSVIIDQQ